MPVNPNRAASMLQSISPYTKEEALKALDYILESKGATKPSKEINVYANGLLNALLTGGFLHEVNNSGFVQWDLTINGRTLLKHCTPPMSASEEAEEFKSVKTVEMTDWLQSTTSYDEHDIRQIVSALVDMSINLEFADTFRVADVTSLEEVTKYMNVRATGCCGFEERVVRGYENNLYLVGCNYGH